MVFIQYLAHHSIKTIREKEKKGYNITHATGLLACFDDVQVFDSAGFLKSLEGIKEYFKSQSAKDFIDIAKGFDTLFKNDVLIAQALRKATTEKISSSIATTISGAVKFQMVKMMFEAIMRLMPHIPFAKGFNEKIQGMALRYHLRKALSQSSDISDFKFNISSLKDNASINSPTRELLNRIASNVDSLQDDIIEHAHFSSQLGNPLKEFGRNYPQYYHKPQEAIAKLLETKEGQVAGAFYKEGLGDIDLVWGNENLGLQKIIDKHLDDFKVWGEGEEGVIKGLDDIVSNGKVISENGVDTIWLRKDGHYYIVGLSEGWKGQGSNKWIITSYEKKNIPPQTKAEVDDLFDSPSEALSANARFNELQTPNPTTKADFTTNLSKSEVFPKNKEFDEYLAENSKYHIDWVDVLDSSPVNVSIMREFILDSKKSLENGINKELPKSLREKIQTALDIRPIAEFGTNYAEHYRDGQRGIAKLLAEAKDYEARKEAGKLTQAEIEQGAYKGQVTGAFYKEGLGDIDLVWGKITDTENHKGYGLAHILDKRTAEFMQEGLSEREAKAKAEAFAKNEIPNIFENGEVIKKPNEAVRIETDKYKLILKQNWEGEPTQNKWLVTAYFKKEKEPSISTDSFTKGETLPLNSKEDSTTKPFKQQDISFENFEDFSKYAKLSGIEFESEAQEREAYKHIQSKLKSLEC